ADAVTSAPLCQVTDTHGNSLVASKLALTDTRCNVTTAAGVTIPVDRAALAKFDYNLGKLTFLSDLTPDAGTDHAIGRSGLEYRVWSNGTPAFKDLLWLGGVSYRKGLHLHAPLQPQYNLGGKYREFKAVVGVDDKVEPPDGTVAVKVVLT